MEFQAQSYYLVYNRGNNRDQIFFKERNYYYFIEKAKKYLKPHANILSYVLLPTRFMFLVYSNEQNPSKKAIDDFRMLLSSYTRGVNIQEERAGSIFQQNSKKILLKDSNEALNVLRFIHQEPQRLNLVQNFWEWRYSSYQEFIHKSNLQLLDTEVALSLLPFPQDMSKFYKESKGFMIERTLIDLL